MKKLFFSVCLCWRQTKGGGGLRSYCNHRDSTVFIINFLYDQGSESGPCLIVAMYNNVCIPYSYLTHVHSRHIVSWMQFLFRNRRSQLRTFFFSLLQTAHEQITRGPSHCCKLTTGELQISSSKAFLWRLATTGLSWAWPGGMHVWWQRWRHNR